MWLLWNHRGRLFGDSVVTDLLFVQVEPFREAGEGRGSGFGSMLFVSMFPPILANQKLKHWDSEVSSTWMWLFMIPPAGCWKS